MSEPDISALRMDPPPGVRADSIPPPASRWRTRVLLPAAVLAAFAAVIGVAARDLVFPGTAVRVVPVVVKAPDAAAAASGGGAVTSQAAGWVEADPFPVYVPALADGIVAEVLVLEGARVEKGQVVARLVAEDARLALDRAEAALRDAVASRETAEKDLATLVERKRALATAEAAVEEAGAMLRENAAESAAAAARIRNQEEVVASGEALVEANATDRLTLVRDRSELDALRASADALAAKRKVLEARRDAARAGRDAAAENLRLLLPERLAVERARAAEAGARAARDEAALRLERMEVRAPETGVVQQRMVAPGAKVMALMDDPHSNHVVHLYDPARLQVRVDVPLAEAARVGVGTRARIVVEVLPDRVFRGEVTRIVHEADLQKNTLQVKVRIEDPAPEIKPEMLARAQFLAAAPAEGERSGAAPRVFAPSRLLAPAGTGKAKALVVGGDGVAALREVALGAGREGDWVEVTSGLAPGDRLVDAPPGSVRDGERVRVTGETPPEGR
jgi:RND family efflux transporter MFP subunit